ncbi:unnamed protein product [Schistosoma rodhaini]|uniref:SCP domain-containing protein n=1 Tax=Schistosoma rodhaini TaxID=6188 RepID=A0A183QRA5_9TREM|nr:unnamed protein product [Schistosoma rodhaini]
MIKILIQSCLMYLFYILYGNTQTTHEGRTLFNKHTDYRRSLLKCKVPEQPRPNYSGGELSWDNELEELAGRQASVCNLSSEYKKSEIEKEYRDQIGINTADNSDVIKAVESWFHEYELYDFTNNECKVRNDCLHYKRIVWGRAEFMGCAVGHCNPNTEVKSGQIIVCYYSPMGDVKVSQPYVENKIDPCHHPPITTTTTTIKPITVTRKLQMGPYGRYRCDCKCQP